jgi:hypothetical protein
MHVYRNLCRAVYVKGCELNRAKFYWNLANVFMLILIMYIFTCNKKSKVIKFSTAQFTSFLNYVQKVESTWITCLCSLIYPKLEMFFHHDVAMIKCVLVPREKKFAKMFFDKKIFRKNWKSVNVILWPHQCEATYLVWGHICTTDSHLSLVQTCIHTCAWKAPLHKHTYLCSRF